MRGIRADFGLGTLDNDVDSGWRRYSVIGSESILLAVPPPPETLNLEDVLLQRPEADRVWLRLDEFVYE